MNPHLSPTLRYLLQASLNVASIILIAFFAIGCVPAITPAVQIQDPGWQAQRFGLWNTVSASTNINLPNEVQKLDNTWKYVIDNGYVTTDSTGQGKVIYGSCTAYIFQDTNSLVKKESISPCARNTVCTALLSNCGSISAVTLPANIKFTGTSVTIVEYKELESIIVISSEGTATVMPTDSAFPAFDVSAGQAAYAVTSKMRDQAEPFFGFPPGEIHDFYAFVTPIENMGQTRQIQSANLILLKQGLPMIPLAIPYNLGFSWLNEKNDDPRISQAIIQTIDLAPVLEQQFAGTPFFFTTQGQKLDVRSYPYNLDKSFRLFEEAGVPKGQEMILAYDESIPGMSELASYIVEKMANSGWITFILQPVNLFIESSLTELETQQQPVLLIGGY